MLFELRVYGVDIRQRGAAQLELGAGLERDRGAVAAQRDARAVRALVLRLPAVRASSSAWRAAER